MHKIEKEKLKKPPRLVGRLAGSIIVAGTISIIPIILALYLVVNYLPIKIPTYLLIGLTPIYYITAKWIFNIAFLFLAKIQLKPVEEGTHEFDMKNKSVRNWMINIMLTNAAIHFIGMPPLGQNFLGGFVYKHLKCKMGPGTTLFNISDPYMVEAGKHAVQGGMGYMSGHISKGTSLYLKKVKIGDGAMIGVYSFLSPGVEVGEGAIIAEYSFVPRDTKIPPNTIWAGIPAKQIYPKPKK
jgi:hypothetical protein